MRFDTSTCISAGRAEFVTSSCMGRHIMSPPKNGRRSSLYRAVLHVFAPLKQSDHLERSRKPMQAKLAIWIISAGMYDRNGRELHHNQDLLFLWRRWRCHMWRPSQSWWRMPTRRAALVAQVSTRNRHDLIPSCRQIPRSHG